MLAGFWEGEVEGPLVSGDGVVAEEEDEGVISLDAFGEIEGRLFEEKAIGDNDIGLGEGLGYRGGGFVGMRVGSLGDNALEVDAVAADVLDDASDRCDGGHYAELAGGRRLVGGRAAGDGDDGEGNEEKSKELGHGREPLNAMKCCCKQLLLLMVAIGVSGVKGSTSHGRPRATTRVYPYGDGSQPCTAPRFLPP